MTAEAVEKDRGLIIEQIKSRIMEGWKNETIARWVISRLQLLHLPTKSPCPIYDLSESGWKSNLSENELFLSFVAKSKLLISGGLEGTEGHVGVIKEIWSIRALKGTYKTTGIIALLEPDSYIRGKKNREPLVFLPERETLWATSGLVNAVILLGEPTDLSAFERYLAFHNHLTPAEWVVNSQNPVWKEIIMRPGLDYIDGLRLVEDAPQLHTSFLASTKDFTNVSELKIELLGQAYEHSSVITLARQLPLEYADRQARVIYGEWVADL